MPIIEIAVRNKIARQTNDVAYICNNRDFTVQFDFDDEWAAYPLKTARFEWGGAYREIVFSGDTCDMPMIDNTSCVEIGVYAGDLHTTTPVAVLAKRSILSGDSVVHDDPPEDVYNQLMDELNSGMLKCTVMDREEYEALPQKNPTTLYLIRG